jgi:hypothetical protein
VFRVESLVPRADIPPAKFYSTHPARFFSGSGFGGVTG